MDPHRASSNINVGNMEGGNTSASLFDTHPDNKRNENVETTAAPLLAAFSRQSFACYREPGCSDRRVRNMVIDPPSSAIRSNESVERERRWIRSAWIKRFDGQRTLMDPQSGSSAAVSSYSQNSEVDLHPDRSSREYVETTYYTPLVSSLANSNTGPQHSYNDDEREHAPSMMDSNPDGSGNKNGETESAEYSDLFSKVGQFLGLVTVKKTEGVKKKKLQAQVALTSRELSEIQCFACKRSWDEITSAGSYVRMTKCGHFLCHMDVKKLAKTGEKCPECKRKNVYKMDCKICVLKR